jgi:hypothetical protein
MIKSKIDDLPPTLNPFAAVKRELAECEPGSLVLRGEIIQYKPGGGLGYLLPGFGYHRMKLRVRLVDATSNEELAAFTVDRDSGPEGKELKEMERHVAGELAAYLRRCAFKRS